MLLQRLQMPFQPANPEIDETGHDGEQPDILVTRLSTAKAEAIARTEPQALIIASDQAAVLNEQIIGKPGSYAQALTQLKLASGRTLRYYTGLCVLNAATGSRQIDCIISEVKFRYLADAEIIRYLETEQPYNCAGSLKSETLGITLLDSITGDDPTALIGLPLIRLSQMLRAEGLYLP
jgi:septum formation protein